MCMCMSTCQALPCSSTSSRCAARRSAASPLPPRVMACLTISAAWSAKDWHISTVAFDHPLELPSHPAQLHASLIASCRPWLALTTAGWLSLNNNPEALGGGI